MVSRVLVTGTVVLALTCGACIAPSDDAQTSEAPITDAPSDPTPAPSHKPAPAPAEAQLPPADPFALVTSALRENGATVDSTAIDRDGSLYVTGTFVNSIKLNGATINSRGQEDVYLIKTYPDGTFAWGTTVGSATQERQPAVKIQDGEVRLVGLTSGRLDCGAGPLPLWSDNTFFFCVFERGDGSGIEGGSFPIGGN